MKENVKMGKRVDAWAYDQGAERVFRQYRRLEAERIRRFCKVFMAIMRRDVKIGKPYQCPTAAS